MDKLRSPNSWVKLFSIAALLGIPCYFVGKLFDLEIVKRIGVILFIPLWAGGFIILIVIIPVLIYKNYKNKK
jgi:hypothetical protein